MILRFSDIEMDTERYELRKQGEVQYVEPLVFNLLAHFVNNPDRYSAATTW